MRILDPVLAPDVSIWIDHIDPKQFEDNGCASVVVGLYASVDSTGAKVLSPISRQQCIDVATKSSMVLQAYFWDDITQYPISQVDWLVQTLQKEGLPIKWLWIDQEQWWTDWTAWQQARAGTIPMSQVPSGTPAIISSHFENFMYALHNQIEQCGVYTNNGFVSARAPGMDAWLPNYRAWVPQYGRQPASPTFMTWEVLKSTWLPDYDIVLSPGQKPELVMGHQFTGDTCILPGSYNEAGIAIPLDVSVFSKTFIESIRNITLAPPGTPGPTIPVDYVVQPARINVRSAPDVNSSWVRYAVQGEILHVIKIEYGWAQLLDGTYVFAAYITPLTQPVPPPPPTPTPTPPPSTVDYVVLYARINVRAKPDSSSTWVRFAVKDEVLQVVNIANGWAQLADGTYVYAAYIAPKSSTTPPTPPAGSTDYVVLYARINVRSGPDSSSTWIRFAVKDEVLHVVKIENGWAQLTDGTYVFADYIKKI